MLTLFASPKPFNGHIAVIQRNAIQSWARLHPRPEIILFGNEAGIVQIAAEFGARHVPVVARNEFGTPLLNDLFGKARGLAASPLLCYVNADIILMDDFLAALERVRQWRPRFLMVGRRTDLDIREPLDFGRPDCADQLRALALASGIKRPSEWIDYFAFSEDLATEMLPLAIGRLRWDNWLIWHARLLGAPVVDASRAVLAIHQNHDYSHHPQGQAGIWHGKEARKNEAMVGGWWKHYTTADATHVLAAGRVKYNPHHWVVKFKRAAHYATAPVWFPILDLTRPIRQRLGLRSSVPVPAQKENTLKG